ncbi:MAG: LamG domain-containing protein, partial [Nanoarchaeota archaeon]
MYMSQSTAPEDLTNRVDKVYNDFLRASSVKEYTVECLKQSAEEGLRLAALQGGRIYDYQVGEENIDHNLVLYLPFNENRSTPPFLKDYSSYNLCNQGINCLIVKNVNWTYEGRFGGAYSLNGKDQFFDINQNNLIDFEADENFTIMLWFKTNSSKQQTILMKGDAANPHYELSIINQNITFAIRDAINEVKVIGPSVTDNIWHHVAVTLNRENSRLTLYLDGSKIEEEDSSLIGSITNVVNLEIGQHLGWIQFFNGTLDEISIYNRTLNILEIKQLSYNNIPLQQPLSYNDIVPYNYSDKIYNISYLMKQPVKHIDNYNLDIPSYPYEGSLVDDPVYSFGDIISQPVHHSLFAYYNFVYPTLYPLCNKVGPNKWDYTGAKYSCDSYADVTNRSIQTMLQKFIVNRTKQCLDFSNFTKKFGYNITEGNLTADILFGEDHVFVYATHPIKISVGGKPPITKFLDYNFKLYIRYSKIHELADHLVGRMAKSIGKIPTTDAYNIRFDLTSDYPADCGAGFDELCRDANID